MTLSDNARGAFYMSLSMAGFGINDGLIKLAFVDLPLAQSIAIRGAFASLILVVIAWRSGAFSVRLSKRDAVFLGIRTVSEVGATATFLIAIANMPIADATAVLQVTPLATTMAAAMFLGERVGWRRWSAIVVGFVGVLIMVRPGTSAFTGWALLPLGTVLAITVRDLITHRLSREIPSAFASTLTAVSITVIALLIAPFEGWTTPTPLHWAELALAAAFIVVGYLFSVSAMRVGDVSFVSPFRYTVLLWAILVGFVFFGDVPDRATIIGAALVTAAGIYTLWRERVVGGPKEAAMVQSHPFGPKIDR